MTTNYTIQTVRKHRVVKSAVASVAVAVFALSAFAQIASGTTGIDASGNPASEMAACKNGKTQQSRETCMTEVRNANAAIRAGKVGNSGGQYKANALMRCNALKGDDRAACEARVTGMGSPSGSVAGGGVITQFESVVSPSTTATGSPGFQTPSGSNSSTPSAK